MNTLVGILALSSTCLLMACASAPQQRPMVGSEGFEELSGPSTGGLDDYLARLPGVNVTGSGSGARIRVSGSDGSNPPLFVIDSVVIGYEFSAAWSRVQRHDIDTIRVIRPTDTAAVLYGSRGGNGVIEIVTKRGP